MVADAKASQRAGACSLRLTGRRCTELTDIKAREVSGMHAAALN